MDIDEDGSALMPYVVSYSEEGSQDSYLFLVELSRRHEGRSVLRCRPLPSGRDYSSHGRPTFLFSSTSDRVQGLVLQSYPAAKKKRRMQEMRPRFWYLVRMIIGCLATGFVLVPGLGFRSSAISFRVLSLLLLVVGLLALVPLARKERP